MRFFARDYRCIAFNARGYPPSDVPEDGARYSQARARDDIIAVLDHLKIDRAHVVGLSMGGFATLHFGIAYPNGARSLVVAGCGYGAEPDQKEKFQAECEAAAASLRARLDGEGAEAYALGPTRVQFQNKDPRGWAEFAAQLARAFDQGLGAHHARRADEAPLAVRADRRHEALDVPDPDRHRRRGRALPRARRC